MRKGYRANSRVAFAQYVSTADFSPVSDALRKGGQMLSQGAGAVKQAGQRGFDTLAGGVSRVGNAVSDAGASAVLNGAGTALNNPTGLKNKLGQAVAGVGRKTVGVGRSISDNAGGITKGALAAGGIAAAGAGAAAGYGQLKKRYPLDDEETMLREEQ